MDILFRPLFSTTRYQYDDVGRAHKSRASNSRVFRPGGFKYRRVSFPHSLIPSFSPIHPSLIYLFRPACRLDSIFEL